MTEETLKTILVVDDDDNWLDVYMQLLEGAGEVIVAATVAEAETILKSYKITDVLTDGMGGGWIAIVNAAAEAKVKNVVLISSKTTLAQKAAEAGVTFVDKYHVMLSKVDVKDFV